MYGGGGGAQHLIPGKICTCPKITLHCAWTLRNFVWFVCQTIGRPLKKCLDRRKRGQEGLEVVYLFPSGRAQQAPWDLSKTGYSLLSEL